MSALPSQLDSIAESVLRRYYFDDATKIQIGEEFGLSRFKVARIIQNAKRLGQVRIEITPAAADAELSEALRRALGLRRALVVGKPKGADEVSHHRLLAHLGAQLITDVAGMESIVGFASSRSLVDIGDEIETLHDCTVVQLNGVPSDQVGGDGPVELVRKIAAKTSKHGRIYYAPFVVGSADAAIALRRDPVIRAAMVKHAQLDVAVVTCGALRIGSSSLWEAAEDEERADIIARGGIGEICGIVFDRHGEYLETSLSTRTIGIRYEDLTRVREVVGVINVDDRSDAVYAAAKGKWITCLVTNDVVARELLRMEQLGDVS